MGMENGDAAAASAKRAAEQEPQYQHCSSCCGMMRSE